MLNAAGLLDQNGRGGRLGDEGEGTILVNGDNYRNYQTNLLGGTIVELLAEAGDVNAVLTERRADGRRGSRFTGIDLQLDERSNFLCHGISSSTCMWCKRSAFYAPPTPENLI